MSPYHRRSTSLLGARSLASGESALLRHHYAHAPMPDLLKQLEDFWTLQCLGLSPPQTTNDLHNHWKSQCQLLENLLKVDHLDLLSNGHYPRLIWLQLDAASAAPRVAAVVPVPTSHAASKSGIISHLAASAGGLTTSQHKHRPCRVCIPFQVTISLVHSTAVSVETSTLFYILATCQLQDKPVLLERRSARPSHGGKVARGHLDPSLRCSLHSSRGTKQAPLWPEGEGATEYDNWRPQHKSQRTRTLHPKQIIHVEGLD
eukprot:6379758-Amphidinium_carterae.1